VKPVGERKGAGRQTDQTGPATTTRNPDHGKKSKGTNPTRPGLNDPWGKTPEKAWVINGKTNLKKKRAPKLTGPAKKKRGLPVRVSRKGVSPARWKLDVDATTRPSEKSSKNSSLRPNPEYTGKGERDEVGRTRERGPAIPKLARDPGEGKKQVNSR